jgi:phosphatidylglycerophosphate synthase
VLLSDSCPSFATLQNILRRSRRHARRWLSARRTLPNLSDDVSDSHGAKRGVSFILGGKDTLALPMVAVAGAADAVGGRMARRYNLQTTLGSCPDPAAGKPLVDCSSGALALDGSSGLQWDAMLFPCQW